MASKRKDIVLKSVVQSLIVECLRFFYPQADELFDLNAPVEFMDTELAQINPDTKSMKDSSMVDRLVKVSLSSGDSIHVYLIIEIHGYNDRAIDYARRMFICFSRLFDRHGNGVAALVILTDNLKGFNPSAFKYSCMETSLDFRCKTYRVSDQDRKTLEESQNPFAVVILTILHAIKAGKQTEEVLPYVYANLIRRIRRMNLAEKKEIELVAFIRNYIEFKNPECNRVLNEETSKRENMTNVELDLILTAKRERKFGRAEGRQEGREEGRREVYFVKKQSVLKMLELGYSIAIICEILVVSPEEVASMQREESLGDK